MAFIPLLSTAYFPPVEYLSLVARSSRILIEKWENYPKQTWRNRCVILGANGPLNLIVPVLRGSFHKTPLRELRIDNDRRWRELHLRGIMSAYATAPYFEYYFDAISSVIKKPFRFLLDLNTEILTLIEALSGIKTEVEYTDRFVAEGSLRNDYRYCIAPGKKSSTVGFNPIPYIQVFSDRFGFVPGLSVIDMLFNNGPGTEALLLGSLTARK
jgi:hypothetical protein